MRAAAITGRLLESAPILLFGVVLLVLSATAPNFFALENMVNIGVQAAPVGIVAIGMTFVLLTAGVDLSVGGIMFVAAAVAGKMALNGQPMALVLLAMLGVGVLAGAVNSFFVTRFRLVPFIVTLAFLFVDRGFALWITQTRAMNLPPSYLELGAAKVLGVPVPLFALLITACLAQVVLRSTRFGCHLYAMGESAGAAQKAGLPVKRLLTTVYLVSGVCAALGAILALGQLGAVTPKFGENYEFKAISAAVLGGTSLFGGRGAILPGTLLGVLLIQTIENGLVLLNADPYLYPLVMGGTIFVAVLLDSARGVLVAHLNRRRIR